MEATERYNNKECGVEGFVKETEAQDRVEG